MLSAIVTADLQRLELCQLHHVAVISYHERDLPWHLVTSSLVTKFIVTAAQLDKESHKAFSFLDLPETCHSKDI